MQYPDDSQSFPIRSAAYYDGLLRELDDRSDNRPITTGHRVVPPLDLRRTGISPRSQFGSSLTSRPNTGRPSTGRPGTSRTSSEQMLERESRRIEFLCERESKMTCKTVRVTPAMLKLITNNPLRGKELVIEQALLGPYRDNEERFSALVAKVQATEGMKERKKKIVPRPNTAKKEIQDVYNVSNLQEQIAVVAQRRNTMISIQNFNLRRNTVLWQKKIEQHAAQQTQEESSYARQKKWLELLTVVNKMQLMGRVVAHVRAVRARDVTKWRAVTVIQRYWRKFCPSKRGAVKESFIVNLRKTMGAAAGAKLLQYQARVNACTVLISFLRNKGFKVSVFQFIWKVKQLQRKFRAHLSSNKFRVDVLSRCLDLCGSSLALHIHIVHAGRGFDLRNLTTYENDQMKRLLQDGRNHRLVRQMQTPAFHAYLRANIQKFSFLLRDSVVAMLNFNRAAVDSAVRRPLLLDVVFRKRRQYSLLFNSQMRLEINIPKVNVEDARSFVHGGADPVSSFLEAVARKEGDLVSNYQQRRRKAKEAAAESGADCKLANNTMLFLHAVKVEEVASWALSIAEKACQIFNASVLSRPGGALVQSDITSPQEAVAGSKPALQHQARRPTSVNQRRPSFSGGSLNVSSGDNSIREQGSEDTVRRGSRVHHEAVPGHRRGGRQLR